MSRYYYKKHGEKYLKVTTENNEIVDVQWVDKIDEDEEVIYSKEEELKFQTKEQRLKL